MSPVLSIDELHAGYGSLPVVRDLTLHVEQGEVVALLGPNGAGKSTTLLSVSALLPPLRGTIRALGIDVTSVRRPERMAARGLSHVPEGRGIFNGLSVRENLRLGSPNARSYRSALPQVMEFFPELEPLMGRRAGLLSGGEQQMVALGRALAGQPRLLLIDELSLGLAPVVVQRLLPRLPKIATSSGCGILFVEQHIQQALAVADRAYVLVHGDLVAEGTSDQLSRNSALLQSSYMGLNNLDDLNPVAEKTA